MASLREWILLLALSITLLASGIGGNGEVGDDKVCRGQNPSGEGGLGTTKQGSVGQGDAAAHGAAATVVSSTSNKDEATTFPSGSSVGPDELEGFVRLHRVVVVSFCDDKAAKCLLLAKEMQKASERGGGARYASVNVARHPSAANIYGIDELPTIRLFIRGRLAIPPPPCPLLPLLLVLPRPLP